MKKYSKPVIQTEIVTDINETIFLADSGDWSRSSCYITTWSQTQEAATGMAAWVFQVDCYHGNPFPNYCEHHNENQYLIVEFKNALPDEVEGVYMGSTLAELNEERTMARIQLSHHNNGMDHIGLADYTIRFHGEGGEIQNNALYDQIGFKKFLTTDYGLRINGRS